MTVSAPSPTSARPSSARKGPICISRPRTGRPAIAVTVAMRAATPQRITPPYRNRCGKLQNVSRPTTRCHETSHAAPNQLRQTAATPMTRGTVVPRPESPARRSGSAIVAMTTPILRTGLQQLDPRALLANGQSGNDDPPSRMALPAHREPAHTEPRDAAQLAPVDRLRGRHERSRPARFHLDEDEAIAVAADEIDLAEPGSFVTGDDA